jgi:hypothetical protein
MRIARFGLPLAAPLVLALSGPAPAQVQQNAPAYSYADLADLALPASVVAQVRIAGAARLKPAEAPGLSPGLARFYVQADILTLIRGPGDMPARVTFLADLPNRPDGKATKLRKGEERLVFAQAVPGRPSELRLIGPTGLIAATPADAARLRTILREAVDVRAAPRITGIGKAFHVPGSLPGESETQIFLLTADNRPVSLNVLRRPGEGPRWSVALTEIVDEAAAAPARETLLWYRLACGLPRELPPQSLAEVEAAEAAAVRTDYRFVLSQLGSCGRTRASR